MRWLKAGNVDHSIWKARIPRFRMRGSYRLAGRSSSLADALVAILTTWFAALWVARRLTQHTTIRESLKQLIDTVVSIVGSWILGLMIAATIVLPRLIPASLIAGSGSARSRLALPFRTSSRISWRASLYVVRQKMRICDVIKRQDIVGKVEHISLRETHVRKLSNELTLVPNSTLFKNPVEILTDKHQRRHEIIVGVSYLELARGAIRAAMEGIKLIYQN